MDAFELLKADHRKVSKLFDQLESVDGNKKLGLFEQIKAELDLHAHIEETILYPALERPEATHEMTLESLRRAQGSQNSSSRISAGDVSE